MVLTDRPMTEDEMQGLVEAAADSDYIGVFDGDGRLIAVVQDERLAREIVKVMRHDSTPMAVIF